MIIKFHHKDLGNIVIKLYLMQTHFDQIDAKKLIIKHGICRFKDFNRIYFTLSKPGLCVFAEETEFMLTTLCDRNTMRYIDGRKNTEIETFLGVTEKM